MTAIEAALTRLVDYAGLYPPASLDMRTAVRNYLGWREQSHSWMLGRFIVEMGRLEELREAAGAACASMRLSVIAPPTTEPDEIEQRIGEGFAIDSIEVKCIEPLRITRLKERLCAGVDCYFEIPIREPDTSPVDALAAVDARAKLRMGGVTSEAFPAPADVANRLALLADRSVSFKATAGLHHPLRSLHPLTYAADSPAATMHGFVNLLCAAALIHFGGPEEEARALLEEQDPRAFRVTREFVAARNRCWNTGQLREVRQFFTSFGSCSFTEPVRDLEALGWI